MMADGKARGRTLNSSRNAQMPFSIVAVLLLVLSGLSCLALYQDGPEGPRPMSPETVRALREVSVQASDDVARAVYAAALDAAGEARALNDTALQEAFLVALATRLSPFPQERSGTVVAVESTDLELSVLHGSLEEDGSVSSVPAYLAVRGSFSVNVSRPDGFLVRVQELDGCLYLPLPLLLDRLARLEAAADVRGGIEATVRYQLSALAQDRVLRGYGASELVGGKGTDAIITEEDVVRAVNIALLLEEMRLFRDPASVPGMEGIGLMGQEVDAAELLLRCEDGEYDLRFIASQAVNGMLDRIVLGLLESMGFISPVHILDEAIGTVAWGLNELIDHLSGNDLFAGWSVDELQRRAVEAGYWEFERDIFNYAGPEAMFELEPFTQNYYDANGVLRSATFEGFYNIDFPEVGLFTSPLWEDFFDQQLSQLELVANNLRQLVRTVADNIALYASLPVVRTTPDPIDGRSWTEEPEEMLRSAFEKQEDWTAPALEAVREVGRIMDDASAATLEFVHRQWQNLTQREHCIRSAIEDLSRRLSWEVNSTAPMNEITTRNLQATIEFRLREESNAEEAITAAFDRQAARFLKAMEAALAPSQGGRNTVQEALGMLGGRVVGPTLQPMVSCSVLGVIEEVERTFSARNEGAPTVLPGEGFLLYGPRGSETRERLEAEHLPLVAGDGRRGTLIVDIVRPWEQPAAGNPNLHLTDLFRDGTLPYTTQWNVAYSGTAVVRASAPTAGAVMEPVEVELPLEGSFTVVAVSGWALVGVDYQPTVTLDRVVADLLMSIWNGLLDAAEALGQTIAKAFDLFAQVVSAVLSASLDPIGAMADVLMGVAARLASMTDGFLSTVLGGLAGFAGKVAGGTEVHLSLFGLTLGLFIEPGDISLAGVIDRIRVDARLDLAGLIFAGSLRLLRMPEGDHTVVVDATVGKGDWRVELAVDPRTRVYEHVVRASGYFGGMVLDVVLPLAEAVNKVRLSLADVPLLGTAMQNLPCFSGTKLALDAGLEVGMVTSLAPTLVVNEVEMNPAGRDGGREWVELYNPTGRTIDLTGWSLVTSHGTASKFALPARLVAPGENFVFTFPSQALDNGGDAFPREESVVLVDPEGKKVDSGPWATDHHDDGRTWQRDHDASSRWVLKQGTPGRANGVPYRSPDMDSLRSVLTSSFQDAFGGFELNDLGDLGDLIKRAVRLAAERFIGAAVGVVSYVKLFVQAGVGDAAGVVEGGIVASLMVTGETLRDCLLAMFDNVCALLDDPLNPSNLLRLFAPLDRVGPEDLFVQLAAYISLSVPRGFLGSGSDKLCQAEVSVSSNLALARALGGEDRDDWRIEFGVYASAGVDLLRAGHSGGRGQVGVWLMQCTLRPA